MKQEDVCKPKEEVDLEVKDLEVFNIPLLEKWKLRLAREEFGLWKDILTFKYGSWRALDEISEGKHDCRWWKDIRKTCGEKVKDNWFNKNVRWSTGIGNAIKFWDDKWLGEILLR